MSQRRLTQDSQKNAAVASFDRWREPPWPGKAWWPLSSAPGLCWRSCAFLAILPSSFLLLDPVDNECALKMPLATPLFLFEDVIIARATNVMSFSVFRACKNPNKKEKSCFRNAYKPRRSPGHAPTSCENIILCERMKKELQPVSCLSLKTCAIAMFSPGANILLNAKDRVSVGQIRITGTN